MAIRSTSVARQFASFLAASRKIRPIEINGVDAPSVSGLFLRAMEPQAGGTRVRQIELSHSLRHDQAQGAVREYFRKAGGQGREEVSLTEWLPAERGDGALRPEVADTLQKLRVRTAAQIGAILFPETSAPRLTHVTDTDAMVVNPVALAGREGVGSPLAQELETGPSLQVVFQLSDGRVLTPASIASPEETQLRKIIDGLTVEMQAMGGTKDTHASSRAWVRPDEFVTSPTTTASDPLLAGLEGLGVVRNSPGKSSPLSSDEVRVSVAEIPNGGWKILERDPSASPALTDPSETTVELPVPGLEGAEHLSRLFRMPAPASTGAGAPRDLSLESVASWWSQATGLQAYGGLPSKLKSHQKFIQATGDVLQAARHPQAPKWLKTAAENISALDGPILEGIRSPGGRIRQALGAGGGSSNTELASAFEAQLAKYRGA